MYTDYDITQALISIICVVILTSSGLTCWKVTCKKSLKIPKGQSESIFRRKETPQWPKEKVQKDKQRSTRYTYKTKDRVTRTPLKTGGELRCSGRVSSSCSTSDTRCVNIITNPVITFECSRDSGDYLWNTNAFTKKRLSL